jgi:predicted patatin/cPLA2 family phospholipase
MKRALILGPGGAGGAYCGGVVATLGRKYGPEYFSSVYGCSASAYTASYLVSGQSELIETIWRGAVHSNLLVRWNNLLHRDQPILDLYYLNSVLRDGQYRLNVKNVLDAPVKTYLVATKCQTGAACYFTPTTVEEFFLQVRASAAVPCLHPSVLVNGERYIDGSFSDPFPIARALVDDHDEIVVVCNRPSLALGRLKLVPATLLAMGYMGRRQMLHSLQKLRGIERLVEKHRARIRVIAPSTKTPLSWAFDRSKQHINALVDLGINDALAFLT